MTFKLNNTLSILMTTQEWTYVLLDQCVGQIH